MPITFSRTALAISGLLVLTNLSTAQWRSEASASTIAPSLPAASPGLENVFSPDRASVFVSAFVGLNQNTNLGAFQTDCDCNFDGSFGLSNVGAMVGLDVTYQFSSNWAVIAKAYYDNKHTKEAYRRNIPTPISTQQQVIIRDIEYEEAGSVSLAYGSFGLFGRWQPRLERWYVFVGPAVGVPISTSVDHNQEIITPELTFKEGGTTDTQRKVSTGTFDGVLRLEGILGFGYDYIVRPRWFITPEIRFSYPLTKVTDSIDDRNRTIPIPDWKVMSMQVSIGLKYEAF